MAEIYRQEAEQQRKEAEKNLKSDEVIRKANVLIKKGDNITLRHRVIFHLGDEKSAKIAEAYKAYAAEE